MLRSLGRGSNDFQKVFLVLLLWMDSIAANFPGRAVALQLRRRSLQLEKSSYGGDLNATKKELANKSPSFQTNHSSSTDSRTKLQGLLGRAENNSAPFPKLFAPLRVNTSFCPMDKCEIPAILVELNELLHFYYYVSGRQLGEKSPF